MMKEINIQVLDFPRIPALKIITNIKHPDGGESSTTAFTSYCQDDSKVRLITETIEKVLEEFETDGTLTGKPECPDHTEGHEFIECDELPASCSCGKQETE
jgi:hypothetical protein